MVGGAAQRSARPATQPIERDAVVELRRREHPDALAFRVRDALVAAIDHSALRRDEPLTKAFPVTQTIAPIVMRPRHATRCGGMRQSGQ